MKAIERILFVCSGNTCRSPMAEAWARALATRHPALARLQVASAGTEATDGCRASAQATQVMGEKGFDLSGHRSRRLTRALVAAHDLILPMTTGNAEQVLALGGGDRMRLLGSFVTPAETVTDPYERPVEVYAAVRDQLERLVGAVMQALDGRGA